MDQKEVVEEKIRTFVRQRPALPDDVPQSTNPPPPPTFLGGGIDVEDDCLDVTEASICYTANDQQRCYEVDGGFDGAMADPGGCVVLSQRDGTTRVRVKDALALRDDVLEVDDRGYALDGTLLYGSPDGGPYRLARVQGTRDQGGDP